LEARVGGRVMYTSLLLSKEFKETKAISEGEGVEFVTAFFQSLSNPTLEGYAVTKAGVIKNNDRERYTSLVRLRDMVALKGRRVFDDGSTKVFSYKNYVAVEVPYKERDAFNRKSGGLFLFKLDDPGKGDPNEIIQIVEKVSKEEGRTLSTEAEEAILTAIEKVKQEFAPTKVFLRQTWRFIRDLVRTVTLVGLETIKGIIKAIKVLLKEKGVIRT